jgi:hypothetical protein
MKKRILIIGFAILSIGITIWSCKKATHPGAVAQNPATASQARYGERLDLAQADTAGYFHNVGLTHILGILPAEPTPDDINDEMESFFNAGLGFNMPASSFNYEAAANDAAAAVDDELLNPDNWSGTLYADGHINAEEKYYLDMAVDVLVNVAATIDVDDHDCDPDTRPDSVFYNAVDSIQRLVVDDATLTDESNNNVLITLSYMKYSGLYWFGCDEFGNRGANRMAKAMGLNNPLCKACIKAKWYWIILGDAAGGLLGYLLGQGWGSISTAINWSSKVLYYMCPSCK